MLPSMEGKLGCAHTADWGLGFSTGCVRRQCQHAVWEEVPNELCAKLAASMESRWARVVQLDGAYIE
jgi:hypothetical protein